MADIAAVGYKVDSRDLKKGERAVDRFGKSNKQAAGNVTKLDKSAVAASKSTMLLTKAAGRMVAAIGAFAVGGQIVRTISQFETSMAAVGAVSRATAADMEAMRAVALELGSTTEFSASQAGSGLEFLARAGFTAKESVAALPDVLDLATAAAMGLGSAADISSNIMSAFAIEADNAGAVADVLAAASSRANTDVEQLGAAMSYVGPVASSLGIQMSDAAAAIGVLSDAGIQGSSAGTGLRRVLSSLANPTGDAADVLERLGVTLESVNPQTNDLTDIVDRLAESGLSAADALTVFGDRGGPAILALTSQTGRLRDLTGELVNVDGAAGDMADTMRDNLGGDIKGLISATQGLILALGDAGLTAVLRGVVKAVTAVARGVTAMVDAFRSVAGALGGLLTAKSNQELLELAINNSTKAMGDQIGQSNELAKSLRVLNEMSLESARVKKINAEATIAEINAEEKRLRQSSSYADSLSAVNQQIIDQREEIKNIENLITIARKNGVDISKGENQVYEDAQLQLVGLLRKQQDIKKEMEAQKFLSEEQIAARDAAAESVRILSAAISNATGGMINLNEETGEAVGLSERFKLLAGEIAFTGAEQSAQRLVERLGVSLEMARKLAGLGFGQEAGPILDPRDPNYDPIAAQIGQFDYGTTSPFDMPQRDSSGAGGAASEEVAASQRVIASLREEIEVIGLSERARRTREALQRAGVDAYSAEGQAISDLVEKLHELETAQQRNEQMASTFKDSIIDAAMGGADAFDQLKDAIKRAALEYLLFGEGMFAPSGGGGFGGLLSGLFGGLGIGANASGTDNWRGGLTRVNERGGEIMNLPGGTQIIPNDISKRMADGGGQQPTAEIIVRSEPGTVVEIARQEAVTVTREGISQYDKSMPARQRQIQSDPRRR